MDGILHTMKNGIWKNIYYVAIGSVVISVFFLLTYFSQVHSDSLQYLTQQAGVVGIIAYIVLILLAIVVAPMSTLFLVPVAANSWGPFLAGVYTIIGWTIGSLIAFYLARRYGARWVEKNTKVHYLHSVEKMLPTQHIFVMNIILRLILPVDVLSYALGLFSTMSYRMFFATTLVGVAPFTFLLTYAADGSLQFQIIAGVTGLLLFMFGAQYIRLQKKKIQNVCTVCRECIKE